MLPVVIFPDGPWETFPFAELASLLGSLGEAHYVTERGGEPLPPHVSALRPADVPRLAKPFLALVAHPYWVYDVVAMRAGPVVALVPAYGEDSRFSATWERCERQLATSADLLAVVAEARFLEQSFRREAVLLLSGEEPDAFGTARVGEAERPLRDYETLFLQALRSLSQGLSPSWLTHLQHRARAEHYARLRAAAGPHETISFLLATYEYLIGDFAEAEAHLDEAFQLAAAAHGPSSLNTHFRFRSAILARQGRLEEAVDTFGIAAVADADRADYEQLRRWLGEGRSKLVRSGLYRLNDDERAALLALAGDDSGQARRIARRIHTDAGRWPQALAALDPERLGSAEEKRLYRMMRGAAHRLEGDRHRAIAEFLHAAETDANALAHILEIKLIDDALAELTGSRQPQSPEE